MKLVNAKWMLDIDIDENIPAILVLENCDAMAEIVEDLYNLCLNEEGNSVLSDGLKVFPIDKMVEVIVNPFSIDFNSKRIQSKLYSELLEATDLYVEEKAEIQTRIIDYLDKLSYHVPYDMITNEMDLDLLRLFKMFEVRLDPQCNTLLERLVEYIKIQSRLLNKRLVIFVNVFSYLDGYAIQELAEICEYHKMGIIFIESREPDIKIISRTYIIDKDKCIIIK